MEKFTKFTGTACPINQSNLNTDQILPARFLKWTRAMGFGKVLFHDLKFDAEFPSGHHSIVELNCAPECR